MGPASEERGLKPVRLCPNATPGFTAKVLALSRRLLATGQGWAGWPWVRECQAGRLSGQTSTPLSWVTFPPEEREVNFPVHSGRPWAGLHLWIRL